MPSAADSSQLFNAAVAQYSAGQYAAALATAEQLLTRGREPAVLNLAAVAAYSMGDMDKAESYWRAAIAAQPSFAEARNNLGNLLHTRGRLADAEQEFAAALKLQPRNASAHYNVGRVLAERGDAAAAETAFRQALDLEPRFTDAWINLGNLYLSLGRTAEAENALRRATELAPTSPIAYFNLGRVFDAQRKFAEAEAAFGTAAAHAPHLAAAHNERGKALQSLGRLPEAEGAFRQAAGLAPDVAGFAYNLAAALALQFHFDEAEQIYRRAISTKPDYVEAINNLGVLLRDMGRLDEAEATLRKAIAMKPAYADAEWNLAWLLLSRGRYDEGWPLFEARRSPDFSDQANAPVSFDFPEWRGEPLAGKSILVVREQGIGDEIQGMRYLRLLKERGAAKITVIAHPLLHAVLKDEPHIDRLIAGEEEITLEPHDYWVPILSLPARLATSTAPTAARIPYLNADLTRIDAWTDVLPRRPRVGLVWRGAARQSNDSNRSLYDFSALKPLWSVPGVSFVSLQKGEDETLSPPADQPTLMLGPKIRDFADTAAILKQLDLLISVDTAVAHLAGALGVPTWVMVSRVGSDWRWVRDRADSPWYPRIMRVFWRSGRDGWAPVVGEVAAALDAWGKSKA